MVSNLLLRGLTHAILVSERRCLALVVRHQVGLGAVDEISLLAKERSSTLALQLSLWDTIAAVGRLGSGGATVNHIGC